MNLNVETNNAALNTKLKRNGGYEGLNMDDGSECQTVERS